MEEDKLKVISKNEWKKIKNKKRFKNKCSKLLKRSMCIFVFLIGIFLTIYMYKNEISKEFIKLKAVKYSELEIEKHLKCPSSAKYPNYILEHEQYSEILLDEDKGDTWAISSYVDSQNYLGAMIRGKWRVVIRFSQDGNNYEIVNYNIED